MSNISITKHRAEIRKRYLNNVAHLTILFAIGTFGTLPLAYGVDQFVNVREALVAAKTTSDENKRTEIMTHIDKYPIVASDDIRALYGAMDDVRNEYKDEHQGVLSLQKSKAIARALSSCTKPELRPVIAELLEKQRASLPDQYVGPWGTTGLNETNKESFQYWRLEALINAASGGKNHDALPALRKMYEKNDVAGGLAGVAIAKIGDPADLQAFIERAKADPKASIDISPYGLQGLNKVLSEIPDSSNASREEQGLIGLLGQFTTRDTLPTYMSLLRHKNKTVVRIAAESIAHIIGAGDEQIINTMLIDKNATVRYNALKVLDQKLWNDRQISVFVQVLQNDRDPNNRSYAAHVLGQHKAYSARPALEVATKDGLYQVRSAAQGALDFMDGKLGVGK